MLNNSFTPFRKGEKFCQFKKKSDFCTPISKRKTHSK